MSVEEERHRSLDDVRRIMGYAKLEEEEHMPRIQSVYFSNNMHMDSYTFLEINNHVLETLEEGSRVVIRGDRTDSAVLCTGSQTYDVKEQETSNGLLLLADLDLPNTINGESEQHVQSREVLCLNYKYYELRDMQPRLKKLQQLLEENVFSGKECEEDEEHQGKKYSHADILDVVQASEEEMTKQLSKLEACFIDGHWRLLDGDFKGKVLEHILSLREENGWPWHGVPLQACWDTLQTLYDTSVIESVLCSFSDEMKETEQMETDSTEGRICSLNEDKICRFYAESILKAVGQMNFSEFEKVWRLSIPEGLKSSQYQLEGLALINKDSTPEVIRYFPEAQLPETPPERFNYLFKIRPKWCADEITPYIK